MGSVMTAQFPHLQSGEPGGPLRVNLLGPMTIAVGDAQVSVASKKARALLGYLALREGAAIDRGVLTGLLWGERGDGQARASLRQTLSELRGALGSARDVIAATKESVAWVAGAAWIDARVVETLALSDDPDALRSAAELAGGELLEGLAIDEPGFENWLAGERERFRLLACGVLVRMMRCAERDRRPEEALAIGQKLLALDPLQEAVHRGLMRLYAAQGRPDAALSQYERCRRELARQLDVQPEPETDALARSIRAGRRAGPATRAPRLGPTPSPGPASVAVLPFANLSGDPSQQYFSDGVTEDIITELSRYQSLRVIARNSSFRFRGDVDAAAVRAALGARYLVEGSVRRVANRMRVTAQLVDALTHTQVWAERYDRDINDVFEVQEDVARSIVATLEGRIAARGAEQTRRKPTAEWAAYDYLLRGRECNYRYRTVEAELFFARAAEIDPAYAQAHAWRAIMLGVGYLFDERTETLAAAFASAQEALRLDGNDSRCHHAMAYVALRRCEYDLAGHHHARAFALNPNDSETAGQRANWLMHVGRLEESLATLDATLDRDPFPPTWFWDVRGYALYHLRRYSEAIVAFRSVRAEHFWIAGMLAASCAQAGQMDQARRELARYLAQRPGARLGTVSDKIIYADDRMRDHWIDGLRMAGLPA